MLARSILAAGLTTGILVSPISAVASPGHDHAGVDGPSADRAAAGMPLAEKTASTDKRLSGPAREAIRAVLTGHGPSSGRGTEAWGAVSASPSAAVTTAPTITAPADSSDVSGTVDLAADSTAPVVQFTVPDLGFSVDVPVSGGTATTQVATYGLEDQVELYAADCDGAGTCGDPVYVTVNVGNPAPSLSEPTDGMVVGTSFPAAATTTGGSVAFLIDGAVVVTDTSAPYEQTLYTDGLTAGQHTVSSVLCDSSGTVCALNHPSPPVSVTVKQNLAPQILSVSPSPFSPGHDHRKDTTKVTFRLETAQTVAWRVTTAAGASAIGATSLGNLAAGTHSFTFTGQRGSGSYLPTGSYRIHLDTSKVISGSTVQGHSQASVKVDRTAPKLKSVKASPGTVFPAKDHYLDSVQLRAHLNEKVTSVRVEIFDAAGHKVRTLSTGKRSAGGLGLAWNGKSSKGAVVRAGRYAFRFVTEDVAGNRATTSKVRVNVSDKRLVKQAGVKTVTAKASGSKALIGTCSDLFSPGARGWANSIGYYSDYYSCSTTQGDDLAAAIHVTSLPKAVKYGTVRIDTSGGKGRNHHGGKAAVVYITAKGDYSNLGASLGPADGTYKGPTANASFITSKGRVSWLAGTIGGNNYDIKSFTVRYSYFVLR